MSLQIMRYKALQIFILSFFIVFKTSISFSAEFVEEIEKNFPLRYIDQLEINNFKGNVEIQSWAQEKIRVKAIKKVIADSQPLATEAFKRLDFRFVDRKGNILISNQYGEAIPLEERIKTSGDSKVQLDLVILAPSNFKIQIWTVKGNIVLANWDAVASIRTNQGAVTVSDFKGKNIAVRCAVCVAQLRNIYSNVHVTDIQGAVNLNHVKGSEIFVETSTGPIELFQVKGNQSYVSRSGPMRGRNLEGSLLLHTSNSKIDLSEILGTFNGSIGSGQLNLDFKQWKATDQALIDSVDGNIKIHLPSSFSAEVDLWSIYGKTAIEFPVLPPTRPLSVGPSPANHLIGRVHRGGQTLKVSSETGSILIAKKLGPDGR